MTREPKPGRHYTADEILALFTLKERVERLEREVAGLREQLQVRGFHHIAPSSKALLTKKEAAAVLSISLSSLEILIVRGEIKARRLGRRVLVPATEVEKLSERDIVKFWPKKKNGKTVRP